MILNKRLCLYLLLLLAPKKYKVPGGASDDLLPTLRRMSFLMGMKTPVVTNPRLPTKIRQLEITPLLRILFAEV